MNARLVSDIYIEYLAFPTPLVATTASVVLFPTCPKSFEQPALYGRVTNHLRYILWPENSKFTGELNTRDRPGR